MLSHRAGGVPLGQDQAGATAEDVDAVAIPEPGAERPQGKARHGPVLAAGVEISIRGQHLLHVLGPGRVGRRGEPRQQALEGGGGSPAGEDGLVGPGRRGGAIRPRVPRLRLLGEVSECDEENNAAGIGDVDCDVLL